MTTVIHDPENTMKIMEIFAFISQDDDGNEGLVAAPIGARGALMPLIAADKDRLDSIKSIAFEVATMTKKKIKLIKLSVREDLETIG